MAINYLNLVRGCEDGKLMTLSLLGKGLFTVTCHAFSLDFTIHP